MVIIVDAETDDVLRRVRNRREQLHIKDGDRLLGRLDRRAGGDQRREITAAGDRVDGAERFVHGADADSVFQTIGDQFHGNPPFLNMYIADSRTAFISLIRG